jgi:hypothetical protein
MVAALAALFMLSACGDDKDDTPTGIPDITAGNYDWDIYFVTGAHEEAKAEEYAIFASYLGNPNDIAQADAYTMEIGSETHELWGFMGSFYSNVSLNPGQEYNVKFKKNNSVLSSTTIRMPYKTTTVFPANYLPTAAATMEWTMQASNDYQFAGVDANDPYNDEEDEYYVVLNNSARSVTIPANAVENYGSDADYSMYLTQMNFKKNGRYAFSSFSVDFNDYDYVPAKFDRAEQLHLARKLRAEIR